MLYLLMQIDGARYALDIAQVAEVLPLVTLQTVPRAPPGVAGILDYGGTPVPVIDMSFVLANRQAHRRFNTRIVMIHYTAGGRTQLLGLVAERATETMRRDQSDFVDPGVRATSPPDVWPVALDAAGPVYRVDVAHLLPESLAESLFPVAESA
ncbi:MAG: chemotaxis protein CheW [Steroidobacteraceae bacterium]